jgi:hypothetical protein
MLRKTILRATRELAVPMNSCFIAAALRERLRDLHACGRTTLGMLC